MDKKSQLLALEAEWEQPNGFLGKLRDLEFDAEGAARLEALLHSIDLGNEILIDRNFVRLLWFIVPFMEWQTARFVEAKTTDTVLYRLKLVSTHVQERMMEILGVP